MDSIRGPQRSLTRQVMEEPSPQAADSLTQSQLRRSKRLPSPATSRNTRPRNRAIGLTTPTIAAIQTFRSHRNRIVREHALASLIVCDNLVPQWSISAAFCIYSREHPRAAPHSLDSSLW